MDFVMLLLLLLNQRHMSFRPFAGCQFKKGACLPHLLRAAIKAFMNVWVCWKKAFSQFSKFNTVKKMMFHCFIRVITQRACS